MEDKDRPHRKAIDLALDIIPNEIVLTVTGTYEQHDLHAERQIPRAHLAGTRLFGCGVISSSLSLSFSLASSGGEGGMNFRL